MRSILERLRKYLVSRRVSLILGSVTLLLSLVYQNCAPSNWSSQSSQSSSSHIYPSPYAQQRVIFSADSFQTASASSGTNGQPAIPAQTPITILLDNSCLAQKCGLSQNASGVACQASAGHTHPKLANQLQYYVYQLPTSMSQGQIQAMVSLTDADRGCIVGVSETKSYKLHSAFNDTFYAPQQKPYMDTTNFEAGEAFFASSQLQQVKVGVIDTGIEDSPDLPTIAGRTDMRFDSTKNYPGCSAYLNVQDYFGHGTFIAGIIAGIQNNLMGMAGIAPNVALYAYMIGRCTDSEASNAEIGNAIIQAVSVDQVDVINLSYGGPGSPDVSMEAAIAIAMNANVMIVTAAGNLSSDNGVAGFYPADYSQNYVGVIAVAAANPTGTALAPFSNYSSSYVNIVAPGQGILSIASSLCQFCGVAMVDPGNGSKYAIGDGTSFATPMVVSAYALTIGYLRSQGIDASNLAYLTQLVTVLGANQEAAFKPWIMNGAYLDFSILSTTLSNLGNTSPQSISVGSVTVDNSGSEPVLNTSISWNLSSVHPGARLGVFDGTCVALAGGVFYASCEIQDFNLPGLKGSQAISLNRDQLVAMEPPNSDPTFSLDVIFAIYYPVPVIGANGKPTGTYRNALGIDAQNPNGSLNLRNINYTTAQSQLIGNITNIRMDMEYMYIQGWSCFINSNAAMLVGLQDASGNPIASNYIYNYPWMVPHSDPIDNYNMFNSSSNVTKPPYMGAYFASGISVIYNTPQVQHIAGVEADPHDVLKCNTFTAAQGFEIIVPFWMISQSSLAGNWFQVVAQNNGGQSLTLTDANGNNRFQFPFVNYQQEVTNSFQVVRDSQNYTVSGNLCSTSPSPIEVEISSTELDYTIAAFGANLYQPAAPGAIQDPGDYPAISYGWASDPTANTPPYNSNTPTVFTFEQVSPSNTAPNWSKSILTQDPTQWVSYEDVPSPAGQRAPANAEVSEAVGQIAATFNAPTVQASWVQTLNNLGLQQIETGLPLKFYASQKQFFAQGPGFQTNSNAFNLDRSAISMVPNFPSEYWDYYDVGLPFSNEVTQYSFNPKNPIGQYLTQTYTVNFLLREMKKYESPLPQSAVVFAHGALQNQGSSGCGTGYQHALSPLVIQNYINFQPSMNYWAFGFYAGTNVPNGYTNPPNPQVIMQRLPLELRFFQDGKLILHMESTGGTSSPNMVEVRYPFQNGTY
jgi:hypothetical protein